MKHFILLVSLIFFSSLAIRDNNKEHPNLADPTSPLSLTCPAYLPVEYKVSEKPNGVNPEAVLTVADQNWYSAAVEKIMIVRNWNGRIYSRIYDIIGREIKTLLNEMKRAGYHKMIFNATDLSSGVYFYRMTSGDFVAVKKFVVLK